MTLNQFEILLSKREAVIKKRVTIKKRLATAAAYKHIKECSICMEEFIRRVRETEFQDAKAETANLMQNLLSTRLH